MHAFFPFICSCVKFWDTRKWYTNSANSLPVPVHTFEYPGQMHRLKGMYLEQDFVVRSVAPWWWNEVDWFVYAVSDVNSVGNVFPLDSDLLARAVCKSCCFCKSHVVHYSYVLMQNMLKIIQAVSFVTVMWWLSCVVNIISLMSTSWKYFSRVLICCTW